MNLDDLTILDLSQLLPGPYATQLLAEMGATVIKIEPPETGDPARHLRPLGDQEGTLFGAMNRGKKSVEFDLKNPTDRADFFGLSKMQMSSSSSFAPASRCGLAGTTKPSRNKIQRSYIARSQGTVKRGTIGIALAMT